MFGWESLPWLVEMGVIGRAVKLGREMTKEEYAEAYKEEFDLVWNAMMKARVASDTAMANLYEHDRRTNAMSGALQWALAAGVLSFLVGMAALGL
jgi:hypothetical protein